MWVGHLLGEHGLSLSVRAGPSPRTKQSWSRIAAMSSIHPNLEGTIDRTRNDPKSKSIEPQSHQANKIKVPTWNEAVIAMSKSTLSSVVSTLVRASMGTSVSHTVPDEDLDKHVADIILKEAKQKAENYNTLGIRAYLPAGCVAHPTHFAVSIL